MTRILSGRSGRLASFTLAAFLGSTALGFAAGTLDVAIIGEPPTLDPMMSTADVVSIVTQHFYETLYTFDENWDVAPLLADALPFISEDGKTYKIPLREGITFHDGSAMDSADVVDSLKRWTTVAARGKSVAGMIDSIEAEGPSVVVIKLNKPYSPLLSLLAFSNSAAIVVPQEILGEKLSATVGTGPYKLIEHAPDRYIQLGKFDGFKSRSEPASGSSGARMQTLDEIRFVPVPDANTRVEGLVSGQFAFADSLPTEAYGRLADSASVEPVLLRPFGWPIFAFNMRKGLGTDLAVRQAVQAALSPDDMLFAAFGDDKYFVVDAALFPEQFPWNNEEGKELYAQANPEKSKELLAKAGYKGEPLRILTSRQYEFHFKMAEVAKVNLEAAGFTVQLDVVEWATLIERRGNPDLWDIFITHSPFLPEPTLTNLYGENSPIGWANADRDAIYARLTGESDPIARQAAFAELQKLVYTEVPFYKVGGFNALMGKKKGLTGVAPTPWPFFWNAQVGN